MYVAFAKIQKSKFGVPRDILLTSEVRGREVTNQNNGKDALYLHPFVAAADDKGKVIMCHGEGGGGGERGFSVLSPQGALSHGVQGMEEGREVPNGLFRPSSSLSPRSALC